MLNHNMKDLGVFVSIFAEAGYLEHAQEYLNELQERLDAMRGMRRESTATRICRRIRESDSLTKAAEEPNELLEQLEFVPTKEPVLKYEGIVDHAERNCIHCGWAMGEREGEPACSECGPKPTAPQTPSKTQVAAMLESGIRNKEILQKWESDGHESREPQPDKRMTREEVTENDNYVAPELQVEPEPGMIRDDNGKVTHVSVKHGELGYDPEIHENTALKIYCDGKHIENAHTANTVDGVVKYHKKNERGRIKTLTVHGKVEVKGLD